MAICHCEEGASPTKQSFFVWHSFPNAIGNCFAITGLARTNITPTGLVRRSVIERRAPAARRSNLFSCGTLYIMGLGDCHVPSGLAMTEFSLLCGLVWQFVNVRRIAEFLTF